MSIASPAGMIPTSFSPEQKEKIARVIFDMYPELKFTHLIVGGAIDLLLCGMMITMFISWAVYQTDGWKLKALVWGTFIWELGHTAFTTGVMIKYFGEGYGKFAQFMTPVPIWQCLFAIIVPFVQAFYFFRACKLFKQARWLGLILLPLALCCIAGVIGTIIVYYRNPMDINKIVTTVVMMIRLYDGCTMGIDLIVTAAMTYGLLKSKTGWTDTDRLINRLVLMTLETMFPATLLAMLTMIMTVHKFSFLPMMFASFYPKVVVVTFLGVLLSRKSLRDTLNSRTVMTNPPNTVGLRQPTEIHVEVHRAVFCNPREEPSDKVSLAESGDSEPYIREDKSCYVTPLRSYPTPQASDADLRYDAAPMGKDDIQLSSMSYKRSEGEYQ